MKIIKYNNKLYFNCNNDYMNDIKKIFHKKRKNEDCNDAQADIDKTNPTNIMEKIKRKKRKKIENDKNDKDINNNNVKQKGHVIAFKRIEKKSYN